MNTSSKTRNPVLPSPWSSRAPHGFCHPSRKFLQSSYFTENSLVGPTNRTIQSARPRVQRRRNILKENALFRNLNKNTLILSFPEIHPNQIDAALTLCDNDLSETINLLQLRVRVLKNRKMNMEKRNSYNGVPLARTQSEPPKIVKYIPTKYNDVQIVEIINNNNNTNNQIKIMEVNKNMLQMLEKCKTTMLLPEKTVSLENIRPVTLQTLTPACQNSVSSGSEFSPTTTINSSVRSDDSDKLKVYDFTEDEAVLYHLPKPTRKPLNKVGIVLKKGKSGLSVRLL